MKKDRLEALNAAICNPFNEEAARLVAVSSYRRPLLALRDDPSDREEVIGAFKKHITESLLMVAEDPSERKSLRQGILDLAISFPLRELARLDQASREASKVSVPGISMEWPDYAAAVEGFDFLHILDRILTIAEDDTDDMAVRQSAVSSFNKICKTASEFRIGVDREAFNMRLLRIGETTTDSLLRKYSLSMGY